MWGCVILHEPDRASIRSRISLNLVHNSRKYVLGVAISDYISPSSFPEYMFSFVTSRKGSPKNPPAIFPLLICLLVFACRMCTRRYSVSGGFRFVRIAASGFLLESTSCCEKRNVPHTTTVPVS